MSFLEKQHAGSTSEFESDSAHDAHLQAQVSSARRLDGARAAATVLALLMGLVVLGIAGNSIHAYNTSHLAASTSASWLSMWPNSGAFDVKPTVALLAGSSLVVLANLVALTSHHRFLSVFHTPLIFSAPFVGLVAAIVAIAMFYVANNSATADTLTSWSCRWRHLALTSSAAPKFAGLCRASHAAVDLAIILVPVEFLALVLAGWQLKVERYTAAYAHARKSPSPVLS